MGILGSGQGHTEVRWCLRQETGLATHVRTSDLLGVNVVYLKIDL